MAAPTPTHAHANANGNGNGAAAIKVPVAREWIKVEPLRTRGGEPIYVEAAPGQRVIALPASAVPALGLGQWQPAGDGTYRLVALRHRFHVGAWELVSLLGIEEQYDGVLRLWQAGFVEGFRLTPKNVQIYIDSWFAHVEAVRADPEFWSRPQNLTRFQQVTRNKKAGRKL